MAILRCPGMDGQLKVPDINCTSYIHVGRIPEGAMDGDPAMSKDGRNVTNNK